MLKWVQFALAVVVVGCARQEATVPDGNAVIGIAAFDVTETDQALKIVGLDSEQVEIASVTVQRGLYELTGMFALELDGARVVDGRVLDVTVRSVNVHHESIGYTELKLPLPGGEEYEAMNYLLVDPHVEPVLARWNIKFQIDDAYRATTEDGEVALATTWIVTAGKWRRGNVCGGTCGGGNCGGQNWGYSVTPTQYCNSGWSTNACPVASPGHIMTATTIGDCNNRSGQGGQSFVTFACYKSGATGVGGFTKSCVPQTNGVSDCGTGGQAGCAPCPAGSADTTWSNTLGYANWGSNETAHCGGRNYALNAVCGALGGAPGAGCTGDSNCCNSCNLTTHQCT